MSETLYIRVCGRDFHFSIKPENDIQHIYNIYTHSEYDIYKCRSISTKFNLKNTELWIIAVITAIFRF